MPQMPHAAIAHQRVAWTGLRVGDVVEAPVVRAVQHDLLHRLVTSRRSGRGLLRVLVGLVGHVGGRTPSRITDTRLGTQASSRAAPAVHEGGLHDRPGDDAHEHGRCRRRRGSRRWPSPARSARRPGARPWPVADPTGPLGARLAEEPGQGGHRGRTADLLHGPAHHGGDIGDHVTGVGDDIVAIGAVHGLGDELRLGAPPPVDRRRRGPGPLGHRREGQVVVAPLLQQRERRVDDGRVEARITGTSEPRLPRSFVVHRSPHSDAERIESPPGVKRPVWPFPQTVRLSVVRTTDQRSDSRRTGAGGSWRTR